MPDLVPLRSDIYIRSNKLRRAVAAFETICRIDHVSRVTEEEVRAFLRERGGDRLAAAFKREYLTEPRNPE